MDSPRIASSKNGAAYHMHMINDRNEWFIIIEVQRHKSWNTMRKQVNAATRYAAFEQCEKYLDSFMSLPTDAMSIKDLGVHLRNI